MNIYTSSHPTPSIPSHLSLSQFLSTSNPDTVPDDKVIIEDDSTGRSLTYKGLRGRAAEHAFMWHTWAADGGFELDVGEVVGIVGGNSVDYVSAVMSVLWAGGVVALFTPQSTIADFKHAFGIVNPRFMLVDPELVERVSQALGEARTDVIILGNPSGHKFSGFAHYPNNFQTSSRLPPASLPKDKSAKNTTAIIPFSSGTSGLQKAVVISHFALIATLLCTRVSDPEFFGREDGTVFFAPLGHVYGFNTALTAAWRGAYMMLMRQFSLDRFLKLVEEKRVSVLGIVPAIASVMVKGGLMGKFDLGSVRVVICASSVVDGDVVRELGERLGKGGGREEVPIVQGYGMTEGVIAKLTEGDAGRVGSVGKLFAGVQARIVDDEMNDVQPGQTGELLIKSPMLFNGYLNNPTATKEAFHSNGWLKTGDLIRIDNEGFLYFFDRKKEIIKYKGEQISPTELEALLTTHPFVAEAVVTGKWDRELGTEIPVAFVVLSEIAKEEVGKGRGVDEVKKELREWFDGQVAGFKRLRGGVVVVDAVPRNALGKILRWVLRGRGDLEMEKKAEELRVRARL